MYTVFYVLTSNIMMLQIHRQVIRALQNYHRTEAQWTDWTDYVFELEDINKNMISNDHRFQHSLSKKHKFWFNPTIGKSKFTYRSCIYKSTKSLNINIFISKGSKMYEVCTLCRKYTISKKSSSFSPCLK